MSKETPSIIVYDTDHITYNKLADDIKYMLDTLIDDDGLAQEYFLPISKKMTKSFKRLHLEWTICENPKYSAERLYVLCLMHWMYPCSEARDISGGKKGKLLDYIPEHDLCIYRIDPENTFKYILMYKKYSGIIGYINLSIENNIATILNVYAAWPGGNKDILNIFLEKWFIPKYGVTIKDDRISKLLK